MKWTIRNARKTGYTVWQRGPREFVCTADQNAYITEPTTERVYPTIKDAETAYRSTI